MSEPKPTKAAKTAATKAVETAAPVVVEQKETVALTEQASAATETAAPAVQEPLPPGDDGSKKPTAGPDGPIEPLTDYIARVEGAKLDQDVVAVAITHPEVREDRVHPGTYGGIRLSNGPVGVTYSDGTKA